MAVLVSFLVATLLTEARLEAAIPRCRVFILFIRLCGATILLGNELRPVCVCATMAQSVDSSDASPGAESVDASSIEQLTDRWLSSRVSARASSGPLAPGSPRATLSHSPGPGSYSPTALRAGGCTFSNKAGSAFGSATSVRAHHAMLSDGPLGKARQGGPGPGEFKQAMTTLRSGGATLGGSAVPVSFGSSPRRHHAALADGPLGKERHGGTLW